MDELSRDDLVALGAVGALSPAEFARLDQAVADDGATAGEYRSFIEAAAVLAIASRETPPTNLRASILDAVSGVAQDWAAPSGEQPVAQDHEPAPGRRLAPVPADGARAPGNVAAMSTHRRRWMVPATVAAAAVILLGGGLVVNEFADAPSEDRMAAVLNDDAALTIQLDGSLVGLRLIRSDEAGAAVLIGSDVAMPGDDQMFQLWAVRDDEMVGMVTFTPAATGEVAMLVEGVSPDDEFAVTVEPEGGSDQPTSDPIAVSPGFA